MKIKDLTDRRRFGIFKRCCRKNEKCMDNYLRRGGKEHWLRAARRWAKRAKKQYPQWCS